MYCVKDHGVCDGLKELCDVNCCILRQKGEQDDVHSVDSGRIVTVGRTAKTNRRKGAYPQDPLSRVYKVTRTRIRCSTVFCNFAIGVGWID